MGFPIVGGNVPLVRLNSLWTVVRTLTSCCCRHLEHDSHGCRHVLAVISKDFLCYLFFYNAFVWILLTQGLDKCKRIDLLCYLL